MATVGSARLVPHAAADPGVRQCHEPLVGLFHPTAGHSRDPFGTPTVLITR
jgi:hypothetical protein